MKRTAVIIDATGKTGSALSFIKIILMNPP